MNLEIPNYPALKKKEDPVARSLSRADTCAKPCTMSKGVRVRVTTGDKSLKPRKRKRDHDARDVHFY